MYGYRAYTQGWDTARKEKFVAHLLRIQAVLDVVGVPDVMPVCLVDAPPYTFAYEIAARVKRSEVYVSVIPQGRYSDDNIHTGDRGIPDPGVYAAFCSVHIHPGQGIGLYVNNEPKVWEEAPVIFQWLADVGQHLAAVGHFAVMGNFATTWPTPEMLRLPEAKAYMQTLADFPDLLRNGVHEYESDLKLRPHGAIGSYVKWIEACRYHELPTHDIIITEGPWDGVDGVSKGIAQVMAQWPGSGEVKQIRAAREAVDMLKAHYIHPAIRGFCFYMWTAFIEGAATWRDFNPSEMDGFLAELETGLHEVAVARKAMYEKLLEPGMPAEPVVGRRWLEMDGFKLNMRAAPTITAGVLTQLGSGVEVELTGERADSTVYRWVEVRVVADQRRGWIALVDGLRLSDVPPDGADDVAEMRRLLDEIDELVGRLQLLV